MSVSAVAKSTIPLTLVGAGVGAAAGIAQYFFRTRKGGDPKPLPGAPKKLLSLEEGEETETLIALRRIGEYCGSDPQFADLIRLCDRHASLERLCRDYPKRIHLSYTFQAQRYALQIRETLDALLESCPSSNAEEELEAVRDQLIETTLNRNENIAKDVSMVDVTHVERDMFSRTSSGGGGAGRRAPPGFPRG